jgi:hypothetical protein
MNVSINYEASKAIEEHGSIGVGTWTGDYAMKENEHGDLEITSTTGDIMIEILAPNRIVLRRGNHMLAYKPPRKP